MRSRILLLAMFSGFACASLLDAGAQTNTATMKSLQDIARAQRDQAELLRRRDQRDNERAWREENAFVNAKRDAWSLLRFDR